MRFKFDEYVADDFDKLTVYNNSERIRYHLTKDAADAIVEIGVLLEDCRGRLLNDGLILWLQAEFGWSVSDSEAFIDVARMYGLDSSYSPTQRFDVLKAFRTGKQHVTRTQTLALEPGPLAATPGGDSKTNRPNVTVECDGHYDYNHNDRHIPRCDSSTKGSTDPEYLTARIARDRPDILEKMRRGEYPSTRAAAIEAGIVKPRIQLTVGESTTAQSLAGAMVEKLDHDFLRELTEILHEALF